VRILILSQWFDPEPTLKGLAFAKALKANGHEVEVLTGFPNYPGGKIYEGYKLRLTQREVIDGITVNRVALYPSHDRSTKRRMLNYLSFALSAALLGPWLVKRPDVIYTYHPPLTISIPAYILKLVKRAPTVYDIQDLWPDTLGATGMVSDGFVMKTVGRWAKWVYRFVDRIVVLSPGFKTRLIERGVPAEKIRVIYNWNEETRQAMGEPNREFAKEHGLEGRFNVLFAGSLGPAQALDTVLDAAKLCQTSCPEAQFVFVGAGFDKERLQGRVQAEKIDNVRFVGQQPMSAMGGILPLADALLVHLRNDPLFSITIPSKTQAYLSAGVPIVMAVNGDAADLVRRASAGPVVPPEDAPAMAEAVATLAHLSPEERARLGANGRAFYQQELSMAVGLEQFQSVFRDARPKSPAVAPVAEETPR
jgi:glycosyltransferase involved in cell wall biosynthesis